MTRIVPKRNPVTLTTGKGLTEQSHKKQTDINYILKEYTKTGLIRHAHSNQGKYDDVSAMDYQAALNVVADVKSMFESLPAETRQEFNHDPKSFLEYVRDPQNMVDMAEKGILSGIDAKDADGDIIASIENLVNVLTPEQKKEPDPD